MSVVVFPRKHPGEQRPGGFVLHVPMMVNQPVALVLTGIDPASMAKVEAKVEELSAAFAATNQIADDLTALVAPFIAEGTQ
jgi:hypothetical protein